jgi:hypothetical protein
MSLGGLACTRGYHLSFSSSDHALQTYPERVRAFGRFALGAMIRALLGFRPAVRPSAPRACPFDGFRGRSHYHEQRHPGIRVGKDGRLASFMAGV